MTNLPFIQRSEPVIIVGAQADGTETSAIRATTNRDLAVSDTLSVGGGQNAKTVNGTPSLAAVGASNLSGRKVLTVMPTDGSVFWGYTNAVTTLTGTEIFKNQMVTFNVESTCSIWLTAAATRAVRITEGA